MVSVVTGQSPLPAVDASWTLFLDRDGVINVEKPMDYVRNWDEFQFNPGVKEALKILSGIFGKIIVVTNQRGVGKGLMTESDLKDIHENMISEVTKKGGRIDKVYYAPDPNDDAPRRKPSPQMGLEAMQEYPGIDPQKGFMVGNTFSDMEFGRNIGVKTVFLPTTRSEPPLPHPLVDFLYPDLLTLAKAFRDAINRPSKQL
jgi:D-glycero-D-manno-heptose 1,7-bisphosphate phosphatase